MNRRFAVPTFIAVPVWAATALMVAGYTVRAWLQTTDADKKS